MASLSNSLTLSKRPSPHGCYLKSPNVCLTSLGPNNLSFSPFQTGKTRFTTSKRALVIHASYSDGGRSSGSSGIFISGFVLGGIVVGTLGCVFAPQISRALAGADRKEILRKLPNFIYDEEKALEKTRKVLADKIAQLNAAIDDVSTQLRSEDSPNGVAVDSDEVEAGI